VLPVFYVAVCEGTGWRTAKIGTFLGVARPFACRFCQPAYLHVALVKLLVGIVNSSEGM
jgi:hypothetical protein